MRHLKHKLLTLLAISLLPLVAAAQGERRSIRQGNELFKEGNYAGSATKYKEALGKNPQSIEALYNIAGAMYKQGQWKEASEIYKAVADTVGANGFFNQGNTEFKQRQWDAAIEQYKQALRRNPSDTEAKFNLAYAQKMKQEQEGGGGGGQNDQKQDEQQQDQKQDQNQQDKQNKDDKKEEGKQDQQPEPKDQSKADAERMLKAIQAAEDKTKEKVEEQKMASPKKQSGKSW